MLGWLFSLITLCIIASTTRADVDCNVLPDFRAFQTCCNMPKMNLDAYKKPCGQYLSLFGGPQTPCLFECIYNASDVLNGTTLNLDNARTMLSTILESDNVFVDIFAAGYQNCTGYMDKMLELVKRRPPTPMGMENCSPLPTLFAMCAHRFVFLNCPTTNWNTGKTCDDAKEFALNCKVEPPKGSRSGRGTARTRG